MKYLSLVTLALVACGIPKQNQQQHPRDGFQYEVGGEVVAIVYETNSSQPNTVDIAIQVNEHHFEVGVSSESGLQNMDGHGAVLSEQERHGLAQAAQEYSKQQNVTDDSSLEEKSLYLVFDYLSQAPDDYAFPSRNYHSINLANEGISCIKKGALVKAQWNTRATSYVAEDIVVGVNWPNSYGCMGRCGGDCGWGPPSAWTKDCLDHDACSYRNNASGGASDPNCGDEFNEAADDWLSGVLVGCSGR
ncbi:MAG: hypothetical protein M3Q07_00070 [Pseudobdellovibrionaceae bacterium]|nr:hypothetical protein [Pseudobdellovibrionaceae bacterium]